MKFTSLLIALLLVGVSNLSIAVPFDTATFLIDTCQVAGIYATAEDFATNRLTQKVTLEGSNNKFVSPTLTNSNILTLVFDGKESRYKPGSLYGYFHCGQQFRYYSELNTAKKGKYYKVEQAGKLVVYSINQTHTEGSSQLNYFYSLGLNSSVKPLKEENLATDFNDHTAFLESLHILKDKNGKYNFSLKDNEGHFTVIVLLEHFSKK